MIDPRQEAAEHLLDAAAQGLLGRRGLLRAAAAAGLSGLLAALDMDTALAAGHTQRTNRQARRRGVDYIVVGAGAAGCLIAARLAEAGAEVLLVESGGSDEGPEIATPGLWFTNVGGPHDWRFQADPSPAVNGRRVPVGMGRVLGGGTSINALLWVRGLAADFDGWAADGCPGWAFADVLPVYRALEDWEGGANTWRGAGGPMSIVTPHRPHPTAGAFLEAAREMGVPILDDVNGPMREGAGYVNMTVDRLGARASASRAYLRPALGRPNLTLQLATDATRLVFEGTRCVGVELHRDGGLETVRATQEVIVTAGGMNSAKLLMLSGLGDAQALQPLGIPTVADLPGVGGNFQDHPLMLGLVYGYQGPMPPRDLASNAVEAAAYVGSGAPGVPDVKMVLLQLPVHSEALQARYGPMPADAFTLAPAVMRPTSRGRLTLASADWRAPARLAGGFLDTEHDLEAAVRAIGLCRELGRQSAFRAMSSGELAPSGPLNRADALAFARNATVSFGHPVGTCRMGADPHAVVDPQLHVRGVKGLRVADSSIMPTIITGPTQAATQMIAAKAVDLILKQRSPPRRG